MSENLNEILKYVALGKVPTSQQFLPFLALESANDRTIVYANLAFACLKANTTEHLNIAREFIQRAWMQSGFDERLLPLYEKIHDTLDDIHSIKEAYKRLGIDNAKKGNIRNTLQYFDLWQNSYGNFRHLDKLSYDFDILDCMERLSKPYCDELQPVMPLVGRKIRLAYLMKGIIDVNSALVRLDMNFARYHDKSKFEVVYFVLESQSAVNSSTQAAETIKSLKQHGCHFVSAPDNDNLLDKFIGLYKLIRNYNPDIFITGAALADFGNCFLTMLRPAPIIMGFLSGPPPQFAIPHCHDRCVAWVKHPLLDSPVNTSILPFPVEIPDRMSITPAQRSDFNIPNSACLIISTGRTQKFQDSVFWRSIANILETNHSCHFMVVGVTQDYIACFDGVFPMHLRTRIHFIAWHSNYLSLLVMADIAIDTYPSGGGGTLIDSMALGIPVVSFENNYLQQFDQTNWSVAEEYLCIGELIAPRGDMAAFELIVERLINDKDYRSEIGELCALQVAQKASQNKEVVEQLEQIYLEELQNKIAGKEETVFEGDFDEIYLESLRLQNYHAWQQVYAKGYKSDMGAHWAYPYNKYLIEIGLYHEIAQVDNFVEFAPGKGEFIGAIAQRYPHKQCYVVDIAEANIVSLQQRFQEFQNITLILNNQARLPLENINLAFSFLLCQSMPKTLWQEHLNEVHRMLALNGAYIFQFSFHPQESASDAINMAINSGNKYSTDEMKLRLDKAGFTKFEFSPAITLEEFQSDIIWYLCKAIK